MSCLVRDSISSGDRISSEIRSRRRSHLIRSISGSVRVYPNPVRSGSLFVLVGTRGREGGCPVGSRPIRAGPDAPQSRSRSQVPACSHRNGPCQNIRGRARRTIFLQANAGTSQNGAHEGPSRPVLTQPVLRGPTPCTTRGWLTPGKAPSFNVWASQPHTCSMSVEGCPGRGPCEPSRTARRPPMRSRRRSVPRRAVCLLP